MEPLEERRLLAITATLSDGHLRIDGTDAADTILVSFLNGYISVDGMPIQVAGNSQSQVAANMVRTLVVNGHDGDDRITIDDDGSVSSFNDGRSIHLFGGNGVDVIRGSRVRDQMFGGPDADFLYGGDGDDVMVGDGNIDSEVDGDADGVPDVIEGRATNSGDGNNDGVPDSQQQHVASLPSLTGEYVSLVVESGLLLDSVRVVNNPAPATSPPGVEFPLGFFDFRVLDLNPGEAQTVTLILPQGTTASSYWNYGDTPDNSTSHWYEFSYQPSDDGTTGAIVSPNGNIVTLHFVDGQRGDKSLRYDGRIRALGGLTGVVAGTSDNDGVPDAVEDGAANNGDGNNDGIADRLQSHVASLPSNAGSYVTLAAPAGTNLAAVQAGPPPLDVLPPVEFPLGVFSFQLQQVAPGGAANLTLIMPQGTTVDSYWKYGPTPGAPAPHWYQFTFDGTTGAEIAGNVVTLHFVDGQRGDDDLVANGAIVEPGGPTSLVSAQVVGRQVFYNNSAWDGNDPVANAGDDTAIASDKTALLPGQTATTANYTSYNKGINGLMIDVANLAGTPVAADFAFKTGNVNDANTWSTLATAPSVLVRPGAGVSGSTRITFTWPDGTIKKQWLQVTMLANTNTGLAAPDVFYFGNAIGEAGNSATDAQVNAADELLARGNPRNIANPAPITFLYDYNRDKQVNAADQLISRGNPTNLATALRLIAPSSSPGPVAVPGYAALEGNVNGNDSLYGEGGNDTMYGDDIGPFGSGFDRLFGGSGIDTMRGGGGDDFLSGDGDDDVLYGDAGDDTMFGDESTNPFGGTGVDQLYGGLGNDNMAGQGGNDLLSGDGGNDLLNGNDGDDTMFGDESTNPFGGTGFDQLYGGFGNDNMAGQGGDDFLSGDGDNDLLNGNDGHDTMQGGEGFDHLYGGIGNDTLTGEGGDDLLFGEGDNDVLNGNDGVDWLYGGEGFDHLYGGIGNDTLDGERGDDLLFGEGDNDVLYGSDGVDRLRGGEGFDHLYGGAGDDALYGNEGDDLLFGEGGKDGLFGGGGYDQLSGGGDADRYLMAGDSDLVAEVISATSQDARVNFVMDTQAWTYEEVERVDDALMVLHVNARDAELLKNSSNGVISFARNAGGGVGWNVAGMVHLTDDQFNSAQANYLGCYVLHEVGHFWNEAPNMGQAIWTQYLALTGWTNQDPRDNVNYVRFKDQNWWYLRNAQFASYYARNGGINEDFAESFAAYFVQKAGWTFYVNQGDMPGDILGAAAIPGKIAWLGTWVATL